VPVLVADVDLAEPLPSLPVAHPDGRAYVGALLLVRHRRRPVEVLTVSLPPGAEPAELASRVRAALAAAREPDRDDRRREDGRRDDGHRDDEHPVPPAPAADLRPADDLSVVVPTCGRPGTLAGCLDSLLDTDEPPNEVLVVDNRPGDSRTRDLLASRYAGGRTRYLAEPRPGTSAARNRGLHAATRPVVAFLDDDVVVDRGWPAAVAAGFAVEEVRCVTGLILPRELDTPAQVLVERYGGFGKGCRRRLFDLGEHRDPDPLFPYRVGSYGSGANMAFCRRTLLALGGFDPALGPGTPTRGGEDLDALLRVILAGHTLLYEPAAIVWHRHRRDDVDLRRVLRSYGTGLGAVLVKHAVAEPAAAVALARRAPAGVAHLARARRRGGHAGERPRVGYPRDLVVRELLGLAVAPAAYLRSRAAAPLPRPGQAP
jgi:GT2 family glycosyltransferase